MFNQRLVKIDYIWSTWGALSSIQAGLHRSINKYICKTPYSTWGRSVSAVLTVPNDITANENNNINFADAIVTLMGKTVQCNSEEGVPLISFFLCCFYTVCPVVFLDWRRARWRAPSLPLSRRLVCRNICTAQDITFPFHTVLVVTEILLHTYTRRSEQRECTKNIVENKAATGSMSLITNSNNHLPTWTGLLTELGRPVFCTVYQHYVQKCRIGHLRRWSQSRFFIFEQGLDHCLTLIESLLVLAATNRRSNGSDGLR